MTERLMNLYPAGKIGINFDGSMSWYTTTVKLDLVARGVIQRVHRSTPQRLRQQEAKS